MLAGHGAGGERAPPWAAPGFTLLGARLVSRRTRAVRCRMLGCCFGRQKVKEEEVLLPWAPLPADLQMSAPAGQRSGWRRGSQRSGLAPAFGEGALREDEWAPQYTRPYRKRSGGCSWASCRQGVWRRLRDGISSSLGLPL